MEIDLTVEQEARCAKGQEAAVQMLELRQDNMLPEGVSIEDLIRDGRD